MGRRLPFLGGTGRRGSRRAGCEPEQGVVVGQPQLVRASPCHVKAVYQLVGEDDDVRREATVLNISPGGVALSVDQDIRAGALLAPN